MGGGGGAGDDPSSRRLPPAAAQIAGKRLSLVDRSIGIPDDGAQYVSDVTPGKTLLAEMPDQPDFVDRLVIEPEWPHSLGYQCFDFDLTPQIRDRDQVQIMAP